MIFFYPKGIRTLIKFCIMFALSILCPGNMIFLKLNKLPVSRTSSLIEGKETKVHSFFTVS